MAQAQNEVAMKAEELAASETAGQRLQSDLAAAALSGKRSALKIEHTTEDLDKCQADIQRLQTAVTDGKKETRSKAKQLDLRQAELQSLQEDVRALQEKLKFAEHDASEQLANASAELADTRERAATDILQLSKKMHALEMGAVSGKAALAKDLANLRETTAAEAAALRERATADLAVVRERASAERDGLLQEKEALSTRAHELEMCAISEKSMLASHLQDTKASLTKEIESAKQAHETDKALFVLKIEAASAKLLDAGAKTTILSDELKAAAVRASEDAEDLAAAKGAAASAVQSLSAAHAATETAARVSEKEIDSLMHQLTAAKDALAENNEHQKNQSEEAAKKTAALQKGSLDLADAATAKQVSETRTDLLKHQLATAQAALVEKAAYFKDSLADKESRRKEDAENATLLQKSLSAAETFGQAVQKEANVLKQQLAAARQTLNKTAAEQESLQKEEIQMRTLLQQSLTASQNTAANLKQELVDTVMQLALHTSRRDEAEATVAQLTRDLYSHTQQTENTTAERDTIITQLKNDISELILEAAQDAATAASNAEKDSAALLSQLAAVQLAGELKLAEVTTKHEKAEDQRLATDTKSRQLALKIATLEEAVVNGQAQRGIAANEAVAKMTALQEEMHESASNSHTRLMGQCIIRFNIAPLVIEKQMARHHNRGLSVCCIPAPSRAGCKTRLESRM